MDEWKSAVRAHLEQLPAGAGRVSDADPRPVVDAGLPPELAAFYSSVGEVSLPDIGNGFFIHSAAAIPRLPVFVDVADIGAVVTFGSDGGGGLYCLARRDGSIYHLPPGELLAGVYSGGLGEPRTVAPTFDEFLRRLLFAVRAFVASGDIVTV